MRDWHILTNGVQTYTSDTRVSVLHKEGSFDWILQIKFLEEKDAGKYECQVRTNGYRMYYTVLYYSVELQRLASAII